MSLTALVVWLGFVSVIPPLPAQTNDASISGTLAYVIDGDSLAVSSRGRTWEIRLWGIDAPEYDQPGAGPAKKRLERLVADRRLTLEIKDRDRYGRYVATVTTGTLNVNEEMVKSGYSWVYTRYCREPVCDSWLSHQRRAREKRLGLWRSSAPVAPWQWKSRK